MKNHMTATPLSRLPLSRPQTLRTGKALADAGLIDPDAAQAADQVARRYAVAITPHLADMIDPQDPACPIARQYLPDAAELIDAEGELEDPIGDCAKSPIKGLTHRYPDRALLTPTLSCPAFCRFCFRRSRIGAEPSALSQSELEAAIAYVRDHPELWEVVLSGGDPLSLPLSTLRFLIGELSQIPHIDIIRIHTRLPITRPEAVNDAMIEALSSEKTLWMAIHCNHAKELSPAPTMAALRRLSLGGVPLLGQTVLLKGVNDDADTLDALFRAMVKNRVKPYYLHHPDMAQGAGHFRNPVSKGQDLMRKLRARASGLCQPLYVLDIPGGHGKVPLGPEWLADGGVYDPEGRFHPYDSNPD